MGLMLEAAFMMSVITVRQGDYECKVASIRTGLAVDLAATAKTVDIGTEKRA